MAHVTMQQRCVPFEMASSFRWEFITGAVKLQHEKDDTCGAMALIYIYVRTHYRSLELYQTPRAKQSAGALPV